MSQNNFSAQPMSTKSIYELTNKIKSVLNIPSDTNFPIVKIMESEILEKLFKFTFEILPDAEFPYNFEATTDIKNKIVYCKESVYNLACENDGRSLFTLAHELGHVTLHSDITKLNRDSSKDKKAYLDPEWQANTFASSLLIPIEECNHLSDNDIISKYNVSGSAVSRARRNYYKL